MIGIYRIHNKITGKSYVGSSEDVEKRLNQHEVSTKNGSYLTLGYTEDLKKHGADSFEYSILKELGNSNELESWENFYIGVYNSIENGYNRAIARRKPSISFKKYYIENEKYLTPFELAVILKLDQFGFEKMMSTEKIPFVEIVEGVRRYLLSEVLTHLKLKDDFDYKTNVLNEIIDVE